VAPLPHLHPAVPGRLQVREHEYSAALVYSHLTKLGWAESLPRDDILAGAARCLSRRIARFQLRRLPLEFCLAANLKHLPLERETGDGAIVVSVPDTQFLELQQPILRLEKRHPQAGRYVWRALHRGLGLLGEYCSPQCLLYLLGMYYWQGEENEKQALEDLKAQGEDISQIEMIRRADVERQFPKWVIGLEKEPAKPPPQLRKLPFHDAVRRLMAFRRDQFPENWIESRSLPVVYIPWEGTLMSQVTDEHFEALNQEYETVQWVFSFDPRSLGSFAAAWSHFERYLEVLQAVEDVLDGLLGAAEPRPVVIGVPKEEPSELSATHALLLYSGGNGASTSNRGIVTTHTIARAPGRYVLMPGKPASAAALHQLLTRFNPNIAQQGLLPWNLLRQTPTELLWHCPSQVEPIFFKTEQSELNALSGMRVLHPPLVFYVNRGSLFIAALPDGQRPTLQTKLLRAPYFNISPEGRVCQGTMNGPREIRPEKMPQWEHAFFHSAFTHPHGGAFRITSHSNGHAGLWLAQAQRPYPSFPIEHLVPLELTLGDWLKNCTEFRPNWRP
jgi:PRTRC genetic system protein B